MNEPCSYCGDEHDTRKMLLMLPTDGHFKKWACWTCFTVLVMDVRGLAKTCPACAELLPSLELTLQLSQDWWMTHKEPTGVAIRPVTVPHRDGCLLG